MPRHQVANSGNKQKQKMGITQLHTSSHNHWREKRRYSVRKERIGKLLTSGPNHSFVSDQDTLKLTLIQNPSLEKEDHLSSNKSYSSRLSEREHGKKKKIYETYDFTDFLLNHYYHIPKYPSICLEPSDPTSTYQWQRSVEDKGNGLQIKLRKPKCHSTRLNKMQNLQIKEQVEEDDYWARIHTQDPVHKPQNRAKVDNTKECSKEFKNHHKDTAREADDQLTPNNGKGCLLGKTHAYQVKDSNSRSQSQVHSPKSSASSANLTLNLEDFVEEISSDSECLGEILTISREEISVATYKSVSKRRFLDADEIIYNQEIRSSKLSLNSKWKHFGEEKHCKYQLRKPSKRSKYEQRSSRFKSENHCKSAKKSSSKKEQLLAPKYLFDHGKYHKSSSSNLADNTRKRSFSDNTFDQKVNRRPSCVPATSSKWANALYSKNFPQRRKTDYNQNARRFKRHENSTDFLLTSH